VSPNQPHNSFKAKELFPAVIIKGEEIEERLENNSLFLKAKNKLCFERVADFIRAVGRFFLVTTTVLETQ
jgi:hypothetical protein